MPASTATDRAALVAAEPPSKRRVMGVACGAHAVHDGFTDALYVLLPVWQAEFGLSYAAVGLLRALYAGVMAGLQLPAGMLAGRFGAPTVLGAGTALAGLGLVIAGVSDGFALLALGLVVSGLGSSTQHPIGSDLVADAFGGAGSRPALGAYNFAGDVGKMALPALTALLLTLLPWRSAALALGFGGIAAAILIVVLLRRPAPAARAPEAETVPVAGPAGSGRGFAILMAIGIVDSATRMGFLTFLPFILAGKGADLGLVGLAFTLVFAGGASGKLACGWLGAHLGVVKTVFLTEGATALGILLLLPASLEAAMALLPLIGIALNGTSSVLYGSVPELVPAERRARAFGLFYTGVIGSGAVSPVLYGLVSDMAGLRPMMVLIALLVLATLPLTWWLRASLPASAR